jgi:hypothetical protein
VGTLSAHPASQKGSHRRTEVSLGELVHLHTNKVGVIFRGEPQREKIVKKYVVDLNEQKKGARANLAFKSGTYGGT